MKRTWANIVAVAMLLAGCTSSEPTIEHKLAVINGNGPAKGEAEFKTILDSIQRGGGVCKPNPNREDVADILVAGWNNSSKRDTLLEFSRALAAVCR